MSNNIHQPLPSIEEKIQSLTDQMADHIQAQNERLTSIEEKLELESLEEKGGAALSLSSTYLEHRMRVLLQLNEYSEHSTRRLRPSPPPLRTGVIRGDVMAQMLMDLLVHKLRGGY